MENHLLHKLHKTIWYDSLEEYLHEKYGGNIRKSDPGLEENIRGSYKPNDSSIIIQLIELPEDPPEEEVRRDIMRYLFERGYKSRPVLTPGGGCLMVNEILGQELGVLVAVRKGTLMARINLVSQTSTSHDSNKKKAE